MLATRFMASLTATSGRLTVCRVTQVDRPSDSANSAAAMLVARIRSERISSLSGAGVHCTASAPTTALSLPKRTGEATANPSAERATAPVRTASFASEARSRRVAASPASPRAVPVTSTARPAVATPSALARKSDRSPVTVSAFWNLMPPPACEATSSVTCEAWLRTLVSATSSAVISDRTPCVVATRLVEAKRRNAQRTKTEREPMFSTARGFDRDMCVSPWSPVRRRNFRCTIRAGRSRSGRGRHRGAAQNRASGLMPTVSAPSGACVSGSTIVTESWLW